MRYRKEAPEFFSDEPLVEATLALSLPETVEAPNHFAFSVRNKGKLKGFVWVWMERLDPKKPRVPQPTVIAVRVASLDDKEVLLALDPAKFFTEPHCNGFPAVLVRLPAVTARGVRGCGAEALIVLFRPNLEVREVTPRPVPNPEAHEARGAVA